MEQSIAKAHLMVGFVCRANILKILLLTGKRSKDFGKPLILACYAGLELFFPMFALLSIRDRGMVIGEDKDF